MLEYTREILRQTLWDAAHHVSIFPQESRNRILVVQEEGLGNSILTTPLIQALAALEPSCQIEALVNRSKGADLVFGQWELIHKIWNRDELAALGRNIHYRTVLECHPRHDLPKNIKYQQRKRIAINPQPGVDYHWLFEKHEAEYLLDMARGLGYHGERPPLRKLSGNANYEFPLSENMVAVGIGYYKGLRADGKDWSDRHWGNENFLALCGQLKALGFRPVLVGDQKDFDRDGKELAEQGIESICGKLSLPQVMHFISRCRAFVGNDTGLMHVAAALEIPTLGIFVHTNSVKSYPLGKQSLAIGGDAGAKQYDISADEALIYFKRLTGSA